MALFDVRIRTEFFPRRVTSAAERRTRRVLIRFGALVRTIARLEFGGSVFRVVAGRRRKVRYDARPFMRPALDKALPKLRSIWQTTQ